MRVIAGEFRSRRLKAPPGLEVRPTPDRLRESLFGILGVRVEGCVFVDAYAGSGAVGIEALSRGARRAVFIERSRAALRVLRENLESLGLLNRAEIVSGRAAAVLERHPGDIVFLDPPYGLEKEYASCLDVLGRMAPPLTIAQHASRVTLAEGYGQVQRVRVVKQGDNALSFYEP
ncbi:MAG: 16S rRNA (guanine(966)-N(2))-methyltransferase RsmD [Bryobacteraceae bacterium]